MKTYEISLANAENLMNRYFEKGGDVTTVREGVLGLGTVILHSDKLHQFVIEEYYLNEWSSGHRVKKYYKELPKKYQKMLEDYELSDGDEKICG
jgi:hypothetical protein